MSLVNSHSPKTNQTFSFSDDEYGGSADNSDDDQNDNSVIKGKSKTVFVNRKLVSTVLRVCFSFHRLLKGQHVFCTGTFSKNLSYSLLCQKFLWTTKFQ